MHPRASPLHQPSHRSLGIIKPHNHVVAVQRVHDDFCVKIVSVDELGAGIKRTSLVELQKEARGKVALE